SPHHTSIPNISPCAAPQRTKESSFAPRLITPVPHPDVSLAFALTGLQDTLLTLSVHNARIKSPPHPTQPLSLLSLTHLTRLHQRLQLHCASRSTQKQPPSGKASRLCSLPPPIPKRRPLRLSRLFAESGACRSRFGAYLLALSAAHPSPPPPLSYFSDKGASFAFPPKLRGFVSFYTAFPPSSSLELCVGIRGVELSCLSFLTRLSLARSRRHHHHLSTTTTTTTTTAL
ncbi:hypothetical protein EJ06DRAFT_540684, partial [Trichodelitschia bisporula]